MGRAIGSKHQTVRDRMPSKGNAGDDGARWVINQSFVPYLCMYRSHVVSLQARSQCRTGQLTHLTSPHLNLDSHTRLHTPPSSPRWWLAPGRWTHSDRPRHAWHAWHAATRKKKLQLEVPHPATSILPVNVALDPGSLKLPTKFMNRGGVASRFRFPSSLHACCTYCAHWPGVDC